MTADVPVLDTWNLVRCLGSRGFPARWIGRRICVANFGDWLAARDTVPADIHARVEWIAYTFGYRDATPGDGIQYPDAVRKEHRDLGYMPPGHVAMFDRQRAARARSHMPGFDRAGDFSLRYVPGHKFAVNDDVCGGIRDALLATAQGVVDLKDVAASSGLSPAQVTRLRTRLGLRSEEMTDEKLLVAGGSAPDRHRRFRLVEERKGALDRVRAIATALDEADDVVLACLRTGMVVVHGTVLDGANGKHVPRVSPEHPAVVEWLREQEQAALDAEFAVA